MAMTARPYEGLNSVSRLFGAESEPSFFDADKMEEYWGGHWGVNSEYGKLKVVYMHRPGDELTTMKPEHYDAQRDALIGPEYCYYWRGKEAPNIPKAQAQHDYFTDVLRSAIHDIARVAHAAQLYRRPEIAGMVRAFALPLRAQINAELVLVGF